MGDTDATVRTTADLFNRLANIPTAAPRTTNRRLLRDMVASTDAWISALAVLTPTLEELETRVLLPVSIAATTTVYIGPTNFVQRVGGLTLSFSAAIAASDTNYWTIALQRIRSNGTAVTISTQKTAVTGGIGIAANTAWTFDAAIWPAALRYLQKGDVLRLVFTKTGAPAALADGAGALRYEPNVLALVRDTFTRADNLTTLGTSDSGHEWSAITNSSGTSVFGIKNNAGAIQTHAGARDYAVIDAGLSDCTVSGIVSEVNFAGFAVRITAVPGAAGPNGYVLSPTILYRSDQGVLSNAVINPFSSTLVNGDEVTIVCSGSTFTVYKNGVNVGTGTDATYTSTQHGLRCNAAEVVDTAIWDNFLVAV